MRWILRIGGALVLAALLGLVGLLLIPADRIAAIAGDQLRRLTGREVTISGDVQLTLWPVLGVSAGGLEVGNADWAGEGAMLSTGSAAIGVDLVALLGGEIRITEVRAESPTIRLESRSDGRASWRFTDAGGEAAIATETGPARAPRPFSIARLEITDATLIYLAEGAAPVRQEGVDLTLDWPEPSGPARLAARLRPAGEVLSVAAEVGQFDRFLGGAVSPLALELEAPGGRARLTGRGALEGALAGDLELDLARTESFLAALGAGPVALPRGLGRTLDLTGQLTLTPDRRLSLREMEAELGGNSLRGALDLRLAAVPQITAELRAGALDLSGLTEGAGGPAPSGASTAPAPGGWPRATIDASALNRFGGQVSLRAESLDLGALTLGATRLLATNERARLVLALEEVRAYDGRLVGEFVMNNRAGLSVGGRLQGTGLALNPLLRDLAGIDRFTGDAALNLSFLGVGQSVDAIMKSLSGEASLALGRGSIEGIDLDRLLGNFDVAGGTTVFDSASASFAVSEGVARNEDLTMLLPNFEATGAGTVDLGRRLLDYTFTPKALRLNGARGLAVPVRITGPWEDPKVRPDLEAALDLNLKEERQRAEERVKQKLEEKLAEELDLVRQPDQSVEEAVKEKLEQELTKELLKIFD